MKKTKVKAKPAKKATEKEAVQCTKGHETQCVKGDPKLAHECECRCKGKNHGKSRR